MTSEATLLSDQVFQLNTFLWALKGLPEDGPVEPVLQRAGYYLASIERRVLPPKDRAVATALAQLTDSKHPSPCHPDLWLKHDQDPVQPVVELKSHGFSAASSNRKQALKLMASAFDLSASLAESSERRGHVVFATVEPDAAQLASTLKQLVSELGAANVPAAPTAVVGFSADEDGVMLSSPSPADLPAPARQALASPATVLHRDGENDLRPLYFVPWLPGNETSQDPELQSDGLSEFTARVLVHALADVGQASPPEDLQISCADLLSRATFGVYDYWGPRVKAQFNQAATQILMKALKPIKEARRVNGGFISVDLRSIEVQDAVIDRLRQADPADPASNLETAIDAHPSLFC